MSEWIGCLSSQSAIFQLYMWWHILVDFTYNVYYWWSDPTVNWAVVACELHYFVFKIHSVINLIHKFNWQNAQGFFLLFWEHGPWRLNREFCGVLLKIWKLDQSIGLKCAWIFVCNNHDKVILFLHCNCIQNLYPGFPCFYFTYILINEAFSLASIPLKTFIWQHISYLWNWEFMDKNLGKKDMICHWEYSRNLAIKWTQKSPECIQVYIEFFIKSTCSINSQIWSITSHRLHGKSVEDRKQKGRLGVRSNRRRQIALVMLRVRVFRG